MTRVLSYNILVGGTRRVDQLATVMRSTRPDVVGLAEATDAEVVEELAARLEMDFRLSGHGKGARDWQLAVLSRLPILSVDVHTRAAFTRKHLLEVCIEEPDGKPLTVFVVHQTASFHKGRESNRVRRGEVREMLQIMKARQGTPHLVMGDFNSLAPGDDLEATGLLRNALREYDLSRKRSTPTNTGSWTTFRRNLLRNTVNTMINSRFGRFLINKTGPFFARGGIDLLLQAGYVDCFRRMHPHERGFTCPAVTPAGRIDFIFASPELAARLSSSNVVVEAPGILAHEASDHLAVYADFT